MTPTLIALLAGGSFALGVALFPPARWLSLAAGVVDRPDGHRKLHRRVVPLAGGPLVALTTLLAVSGWYHLDPSLAAALTRLDVSPGGFLAAVGVMFAVGLADDRFGLRGRVKLAGQTVAVGIAVASGVRFESFTAFGVPVHLGPFGAVASAVWLLAAANALNLLDGIDGMVGSVGLVAAATLAVMAVWVGHPVEAVVATCLAGALAAFLAFNKPPARIFLGDSGSLTVGLLLGSLAVTASLKGPATVALSLPVALLFLPLLDTAAAVTRRVLTGQSIYTTDRGHLHHRLLQAGLSHRAVLALVTGLGLALGLGVLASVEYRTDAPAVAAAAAVAAFLVLSRLFGRQELALIRSKLREALGRAAAPRRRGVVVVRLQGRARGWEDIWQHLAARAGHFGLQSASVDVNAPFFQEAYHVRWVSPAAASAGEALRDSWRLELPLKVGGRVIGVVRLAGPAGGNVPALLRLTHDFVDELAALAHRVLLPGFQQPAGPPLREAEAPEVGRTRVVGV